MKLEGEIGKKKNKHLNFKNRLLIYMRLKEGTSVAAIAEEIGCCRKTIYNEIKRGTYRHLNSDYTYENRYDPDLGQLKYDEQRKNSCNKKKIESDYNLALYIEKKIVDDKYSPAAVLMDIKAHKMKFNTEIKSVTTIYSYIKKGIFYRLTMVDLPNRERKRKKKVVIKQNKRILGTSIEERPDYIEERKEFGHWEMDCVIGKKRNKKTLLVLTERKTRFEIIESLKSKTALEVVRAINRIENRLKDDFNKIFKTITVDNGVEFSDSTKLEKRKKKSNRIEVYYCHPYSASERGSNENQNKLIRRWFKKSENFDKTVTKKKIKKVEDWINNYPRAIFGGLSAGEMFIREINKLGVDFI